MGAFKNALKRILPPPVNSFMREVNRIVALEEKNQKAIEKLTITLAQQEKQIQGQNEIIAQQAQILEQQMQYMQSLNNTLTDINKYLHEQSALTNKLIEEQKNTVKKHYDEQQRINKDMRARIDNTNKEITYHYFKGLHPDQYKEALEDWYYQKTGVHMDIDNPKTFNEKIQWLKLYDSTPEKTRLADKYLVREWVAEKIGDEYLIPLLGVYDKFDDIDFDVLPNQFVMKANHGSRWNIIVKDKAKFDQNSAKVKFDSWLKKNYAFCVGLEMQYKNINSKIIIEKYIPCEFEYQVWCFNGKPEFVSVIHEPHGENKKITYNIQGKKLNFVTSLPKIDQMLDLTSEFKTMIRFAEILSKSFLFVRVDFSLYDEKQIYFNELTFSPASGCVKWEPEIQDSICGEWLTL